MDHDEEQVWGLRATDDALLRRIDTNGDGVFAAATGGTIPTAGEPGWYQLTDPSFSVIGHVDWQTGKIRQRMSYDSYGTMRILALADYNGDGVIDSSDQSSMFTACKTGQPSGDFNGDGVSNSSDYDAYFSYYQEETSTTSPWKPDEVRVSYAGYIRDPITGLLLARNRWYDPLAGRWVTRDPAGYVDGLDLYMYVRGNPWSLLDPTGLRADVEGEGDDEKKAIGTWGRVKRFFCGNGSPKLAKEMNAGIAAQRELLEDLQDEPIVADTARQRITDLENYQKRGMTEAAGMAYSSVIDTATGGSVSGLVKGAKPITTGIVHLQDAVEGASLAPLVTKLKSVKGVEETVCAGFQAVRDRAGNIVNAATSFRNFDALKANLPELDKGFVWHHVVEQCQESKSGFAIGRINSVENVVAVPTEVNEALAAHYASKTAESGTLRVRDWLAKKPWGFQKAYGERLLRGQLEHVREAARPK